MGLSEVDEVGELAVVDEAVGVGVEVANGALALPRGEVSAAEVDDLLQLLLADAPVLVTVEFLHQPLLELLHRHHSSPISRHSAALYRHGIGLYDVVRTPS